MLSIRHVIAIVVLLSIAGADLFAQTSAGRYLLLKPSAVSSAMGGTGVAYDSPFASYHNPAGLAFLPSLTVSGSFVKPLPFFNDIRHSYITGSYRIPSIGTVSASLNLYWRGTYARTISAGPEIVDSGNSKDWQMKLSYAHSFSENFAGGINVGLLRLNVTDIGTGREYGSGKATSALADAGIIYRNIKTSATYTDKSGSSNAHQGISVGLALSNIGPRIVLIDADQSDPLPATVAVGAAYSPVRTLPIGFMLTVDIESQLPEDSFINFVHWGSELVVYERILLRGGYYQNVSSSATSYWTWGVGLNIEFIRVNVARYTRALLPSWHFDATFLMELP
jgi:hypothetical protein